MRPSFVDEYKEKISSFSVDEPLFSRGTYQVRVVERGNEYYPFLQFRGKEELSDFFCTCPLSSKGCPHLAAAYLKIFANTPLPLHIRFEESFWNRLFQIAARRIGFDTGRLKHEGKLYFSDSETQKRLFSIEAKEAERLESLISHRVVETEETSLKFSNLSMEEIAAWKAGRASPELEYELSFWCDLAKWMMALAESKERYTLTFRPKEPFPSEVEISFPGLQVHFYLAEANWPSLIPTLATVESPLKLFDARSDALEKVEYDRVQKTLRIKKVAGKKEREIKGYEVGPWLYVAGEGFYRQDRGVLHEGVIPREAIADVLTQSAALLEPFLPIHPEPRRARYSLFFDDRSDLHIRPYLFEVGDLEDPETDLFAPWVFLPDKGFYRIENLLFEEKETVIAKGEMADFIARHRHFLQTIVGFQIHLRSLESHLIYEVDNDSLSFSAHLEFPEPLVHRLEFNEWVYIEGRGFYLKKEQRGNLPLHPDLVIPKEEISSFIIKHREELQEVQGFFNPTSPVHKRGVKIDLNASSLITVTPRVEFFPKVDPSQILFFGDFVYQKGSGFSEMTPLPDRYRSPVTIAEGQETAFLSYELEPLSPYILSLSKRLQIPPSLSFSMKKVARVDATTWEAECSYESPWGWVDFLALWDALQARKPIVFSSAGLIILKEARWHWIRQIPKERIDRRRKTVALKLLEWIRLQALEGVEAPFAREEIEVALPLDFHHLKISLRPYQEEGVRWLWFLYSHGLSGLLCDDMGLGKTHQAMSLLAAVSNEDERRVNKYLIVCPTSVIYHWQDLLKAFLPHLRVHTYYGISRSLKNFAEGSDILLTSYGVLRSGQEDLRTIPFEIAIFDEVQIAKNHTSQTHLALRNLTARMKIGLTGTPIENRLRELKALFDLILPGYFPNDSLFREQFIDPIERDKDEEARELLSKLIGPFILRRKKEQVLPDLPEKIEQVSYCDLSPEQRELYHTTVQQMKGIFTDPSQPPTSVHIFSALATLKQICDHPALVHKDPKSYAEHASGKWDLWLELLNEARASGQKVVVFSQYLDMLAIIEAHLKKKGIHYASITGATRDRAYEIKRFRDDPACEVFVASILAAGVGIDLTAASVVVHYDRWWNPAKENQATDRVWRFGQKRGVQVFKLVTKDTIEEYIHSLIERKAHLLEELVGIKEAEPITQEELLEIFQKVFNEEPI